MFRTASAATLFGWAILHFFWDVPYRSVLWNETLLSPLVKGLGGNWTDYVTNPKTDLAIQALIRGVGVVLGVGGAISLFGSSGLRRGGAFLFAGSGILLGLSILQYLDTGRRLGMFIEHASQVFAPLALFLYLRGSTSDRRLIFFLKFAIALTFFGHALYAVGFYPMPGSFLDMTINTLGVEEDVARTFVRAAGVLDLVVCAAIFVRPLERPALIYAAVWGLLTTLARPVSYFFLQGEASNWSYWIAQALLRFPHFLLPLGALLMTRLVRGSGASAPR